MSTRRTLAAIVWFGSMVFVGGCGGITLFKPAPPADVYDLSASPQLPPGPAAEWQLVIGEPSAIPALNTDRILLRRGANVIEYAANSKWSARAPNLVQTQLVRAFDNSRRIVGVSRASLGLRGDFELTGELREFDVVYAGGRPSARIGLDLKLVRRPFGVVAMRSFQAAEPTSANSLTQIAAAFDRGLSKLLAEAVVWTLSAGEADLRERPMPAKAH